MDPDKDQLLNLLPLREPTFFILLSLAQAEKHGYAIMKDVEMLSEGKIKLSTGTLYEALARLLDQELIHRLDEDEAEAESDLEEKHPGKPRKAYRLSSQGRRLLEAETHRMQDLVSKARRRLGLERE
jgi:DNA-binding PadR family transcriptional regulator